MFAFSARIAANKEMNHVVAKTPPASYEQAPNG
jgi:hypothetical protein